MLYVLCILVHQRCVRSDVRKEVKVEDGTPVKDDDSDSDMQSVESNSSGKAMPGRRLMMEQIKNTLNDVMGYAADRLAVKVDSRRQKEQTKC